jgi:branched-chain amino acid transport system permease protein
MLPAFGVVLFQEVLKLPFPIAVMFTLVGSMAMGLIVKQFIIQPLLRRDILAIVIATLGIALFARNFIIVFWTADPVFYTSIFSTKPLRFGDVVVSPEDLWVVGLVSGLILLVNLFIRHTKMGWAMQAVSQNREVARVVGINVSRTMTQVYLLNGLMMGIAAVLIAPIYFVQYNLGISLGLKAFYSAVIGGFNQVKGALFGGFLVGLLETFGAAYISTAYRDAFALVVLIGVLVLKPEGIFGIREE